MSQKRLYTLGILLLIIVLNIPETSAILKSWLIQHGAIINEAGATANGYFGRMRNALQAPITVNGQVVEVGNTNPSSITLSDGQTLSPEQINKELENTPAAGTGDSWVAHGVEYNVDAAIMLAMFEVESGKGTANGWAGKKPDGTTINNPGNIRCYDSGYGCYNGFVDYPSWDAGIKDMARHLGAIYRDRNGLRTVTEALNTWAPPIENDTQTYAQTVEARVRGWRNNAVGDTVQIGAVGTPELHAPVISAIEAISKFLNTGEKVTIEAIPTYIDITEQFNQTLPNNTITAPPINRDGFGVYSAQCIDVNIIGSLHASPRLLEVTIPNGASWSFNENWTVAVKDLMNCGYMRPNDVGDSVCDLAARYSYVARNLGASTSSVYHGFQLHSMPVEDSLSIYGTPGKSGGQDLYITNNTGYTMRMRAEITDTAILLHGWLE